MKYYIILEDKMFCSEMELRLPELDMIELGYEIIEVDKPDCAFEDFDENGFNEELYNQRKQQEISASRIAELKHNLKETDYVDNKLIEAFIANDIEKLNELKQIYAQTLIDRENWRLEIDRLEG